MDKISNGRHTNEFREDAAGMVTENGFSAE
jgi:hypothetical protein